MFCVSVSISVGVKEWICWNAVALWLAESAGDLGSSPAASEIFLGVPADTNCIGYQRTQQKGFNGWIIKLRCFNSGQFKYGTD